MCKRVKTHLIRDKIHLLLSVMTLNPLHSKLKLLCLIFICKVETDLVGLQRYSKIIVFSFAHFYIKATNINICYLNIYRIDKQNQQSNKV